MSYKEFDILMQHVILETIKKYNLFEANNSVIIAVSGVQILWRYCTL